MMRHNFPAPVFPGYRLDKAYTQCFVELFLLDGAVVSTESATVNSGLMVTGFTVTGGYDISVSINPNMTVVGAYLKHNTVNDLGTSTEIDVTANISGSTLEYTYDVGGAKITTWFWVRLVDGSGNESITPLGSHETIDTTPPVITSFTLSAGSSATTEIDVGMAGTDNSGSIQTLYLMVSDTQTTAPTATEIKTNGSALAGSTTTHMVSGLTPDTVYYGWLLARDASANETVVTASTPATLTTAADVTPPAVDNSSLTNGPDPETQVTITLSFSDVVG